jgi:hypothetical protein
LTARLNNDNNDSNNNNNDNNRAYMANEIDNFDVFIYQEDDIIFKFSHLSAYISENKKLHLMAMRNPDLGLHNKVRLGLRSSLRLG